MAKPLLSICVPVKDLRRFCRYAQREKSGCWRWTGSYNRGYGKFWYRGKTIPAHRFACLLMYGEVDGYFACHTCNHAWCVNPYHLYLGNRDSNGRDLKASGRVRGEKNGQAKLTWEKVREIRRRFAAGESAPALAPEFGIAYRYLYNIVYNRTWKES